MVYPTKFPKTAKEIPADTKFLVLLNDSYSAAGYDPGEPSYPVHYLQVLSFSSVELLREWVATECTAKSHRSARDPSTFVVLPYTPAKVEVSIEVRTTIN